MLLHIIECERCGKVRIGQEEYGLTEWSGWNWGDIRKIQAQHDVVSIDSIDACPVCLDEIIPLIAGRTS